MAAAVTPFVVPRIALDDDTARGYFPDYPYDAALPAVHDSSIVLQSDYGTDFDSMSHAHGRNIGISDNPSDLTENSIIAVRMSRQETMNSGRTM